MIKRAKVKILLGNFIDTFLEIDGVNYPAREIVLTQRIEENGPVTRLKLTRCFNSEGVFTPDLFGRPIVEEFIASPLIIATDKREFDTTTTLHEQLENKLLEGLSDELKEQFRATTGAPFEERIDKVNYDRIRSKAAEFD